MKKRIKKIYKSPLPLYKMIKKVVKLKKNILMGNKTTLLKRKISLVKKNVVKTVHRDPIHVERAIIENFITFQKIMTNFSIKFDKLTFQIILIVLKFEMSVYRIL